jgi:radical SAM superfamily enzyme YgiQ (UPF0313 family)
MNYQFPLYRPPAEAGSVIFQVTNGCSWNKCTFCEMYSSKSFSIKKPELIKAEIHTIKESGQRVHKVFLADGDALVLSTVKLLDILQSLKEAFPSLRRVSAYAKPRDIETKTSAELQDLKAAGLDLVYVGLESGSDQVLKQNHKGETFESSASALYKCKKAGIRSSVMILNGMGGTALWEDHAIQSARLVNEIQPEYLSTLVLSFPFGIDHYRKRVGCAFDLPDTTGLLKELGLFIARTELESTIYRSDHASNYLPLKGILGRDKETLIHQISSASKNPGASGLRAEWQRGL